MEFPLPPPPKVDPLVDLPVVERLLKAAGFHISVMPKGTMTVHKNGQHFALFAKHFTYRVCYNIEVAERIIHDCA